ncbi:hypothetical protein THOM_1328 [Trachipleistophora hominis]|uniref:Uncharacterized protein n=1 Tax=Trachipleistophora hominis TaxID=72359 RepID=L7JX99_TRAHO|nr:hypothetical protein THOM_1328 [Trachipleistophora hominis]
MIHNTIMQPVRHLPFKTLVLFALMTNMLNASTPVNILDEIYDVRRHLCTNAIVSGDDTDRLPFLYVAGLSLPPSTDAEVLVRMNTMRAAVANSYATQPLKSFWFGSENDMNEILKKVIDKVPSKEIAAENNFTKLAKKFLDEFHEVTSKIVKECGSYDVSHIKVFKIDPNNFDDAIAVIENGLNEEERTLDSFETAYTAFVKMFEHMETQPNDVRLVNLAKAFYMLLNETRAHIILIYQLYGILIESSSSKSKDSSKKATAERVGTFHEFLRKLKAQIDNDRLEKKHFITTAKMIVRTLNDFRMTCIFMDENSIMLANFLIYQQRKHLHHVLSEELLDYWKSSANKRKNDYEKMESKDKKEINMRMWPVGDESERAAAAA